jgi:hypothetical protein
MLTYENFQRVFELGNKPYWWLYLGKTKGQPIASNHDDGDMASAWEKLNNFIESYGDGIYTVEVKSAPTVPKGNPIHTFFVGDAPGTNTDAARVAGIQGMDSNWMKGMNMQYWIDKVESLQAQVNALQLDKLRLENQLGLEKMARKASEAQPDRIDKIMGIVAEKPEILNVVLRLFAPQPTAIGTLSARKPIPPIKTEEIEEGYDDDEEEDYKDDTPVQGTQQPQQRFSIDRAVNACIRVQRALPSENVNDLLDRIANTAETAPDKIKMAINFL